MTKNNAIGGMDELEKQVDLLCARGDALAREIRRLQEENRKLRDNNVIAKQKIRDIMAQIPEVDDIGSERIN
ncbi:MAG: hypothetical protein ACNYPH_08015 [Gammaproteobacteria bacterium WSBS_2016_MAG_OTU1]